MWVAVELVAIPALLIVWIIVSTVVERFGIGAIMLGAVLLVLVSTALGNLVRFLGRLEREEGVPPEDHPSAGHASSQGLRDSEKAIPSEGQVMQAVPPAAATEALEPWKLPTNLPVRESAKDATTT